MAQQLHACQHRRVGGRGRREREENSGEAREDSDSQSDRGEARSCSAIEGEDVGETAKRLLTVAAVLIAREGGNSLGGNVQSSLSSVFPRHPCPPARKSSRGRVRTTNVACGTNRETYSQHRHQHYLFVVCVCTTSRLCIISRSAWKR